MATLLSSEAIASASEATEFGAAIRDMRIAHGTDLATVASTLRIRQVYLQAIEEGRFDDLPGPTYAAGFVRAYAEYLGLDISEVMRRYREVALGSDRQAPLVAPSPVSEGTMPTGTIFLVGAVLAAVAYGAWNYLTLQDPDAGDIVAKIPQQIAEIVGMDVATTETPAVSAKPDEASETTVPSSPVTDTTDPVPAPETEALAGDQESSVSATPSSAKPQSESTAVDTSAESAPQNQADQIGRAISPPSNISDPAAPTETAPDTAVAAGDVAATDRGQEVTATASATAREQAAARSDAAETASLPPPALPLPVTEASTSDAGETDAVSELSSGAAAQEPASRVTIRATAISWVELRDASGKRVFSRLLKKGETYDVPAREGIKLATGNAGALDVLVDGQTIGTLGPVGAVRRGVLMEPDTLLRRSRARQ